MKITCLGAGTWGFSIACLLAKNGHKVTLWARNPEQIKEYAKSKQHPKLPGFKAPNSIVFTHDLEKAVHKADLIIESITSSGIRSVFGNIHEIREKICPIVVTSKGIEQNTGLLLHELIAEFFPKEKIGCISGPSHAEEVIKGLPTSVVCSAYNKKVMMEIMKAFNSENFRVYPNDDIYGVSFGGAMKNIIAIACGISDGLGFGDNTKAALMTRGLHEMRKLCPTKGGKPETLNGLSGMGDLCVTCLSNLSRNYRFGNIIAEGIAPEQAKTMIGMVVEGIYTSVSALQLGQKHNIELPITKATYDVIFEGVSPKEAVRSLLTREIKPEHL